MNRSIDNPTVRSVATLSPVAKETLIADFYALVTKIPRGYVTTYGELAAMLKLTPRYVGYLLHINPDAPRIPCHRVVNAQGQLAVNFGFGGEAEQSRRLRLEGVTVKNSWVDLAKFGWQPY